MLHTTARPGLQKHRVQNPCNGPLAKERNLTGCRCSSKGVRSFHRQVPESFGPPRERACQGTGDVGCPQHDCKDLEKWFPEEFRHQLFFQRQIWKRRSSVCPIRWPSLRGARHRSVLRSGGGGFIPLMPAEHYQWIEDRQRHSSMGNSARVLELTSKMA